ncbi:cation:proton antiporter domain-containing protein [Terriglobus albidus]|uniref:cation:proton antiporter domain-containing protein n=1 Tax=Terriglobus albidus TaxID=1592106 RepID=UPI0021DF9A0A|nr:cation:proton antiporter [Terriglobus albidus]
MTLLILLPLQLAVILAVTWLCGALAQRLSQPRVIGEIAGGILLGPVALGRWMPAVTTMLFAPARLSWLELLSNVGLVAFLFLVGAELDLREVAHHVRRVVATTAGSILLPFLVGALLAPILLRHYGVAEDARCGFRIFLAVAMSITALPVLARILRDRETAGVPVNAEVAQQSLLSAALNDALAWCVLAALLAVLHGGGAVEIVVRLSLLVAFIVVMMAGVRPMLRRVSLERPVWTVVLVLLPGISAWVTNALGIHLFFGAFLAGICVPSERVAGIMERLFLVVSAWTLPAFFALTGLRMRPELFHAGGWSDLLLVLAAAVLGKIVGGMFGAVVAGTPWSKALRIGVLLNTRGLVELIVLNAGYREGILNAQVFTLLVLMAVVTTAMTGPLLDLTARRNVV